MLKMSFDDIMFLTMKAITFGGTVHKFSISLYKDSPNKCKTFFLLGKWTLLNNSSVLPNNLAKLTNKSLDTVNFSTDDISKIINNLDPNKAHGHDMLSIRMKKFCGDSIFKPLSIIFNDCLKEEKFPSDWKKAHC